MYRVINLLMVALIGLFVISCSISTTQSRFVRLGDTYPSHGVDCNLEIFREGVPNKKFVKTSRIDVHLEKNFYVESSFNDALPEIKKNGCLSGADAIIDIQERYSSFSETKSYHIIATGIKYIK